MLVGAYPFEDQADPKNFRKTIGKIMSVQYKIPDHVHISQDCKQLLSRIFVASPTRRITIREIKLHPWFMKNLPRELTETAQAVYYKRESAPAFSLQSVEDIMKIVGEARTAPPASRSVPGFGWAEDEDDEGEGKAENREGEGEGEGEGDREDEEDEDDEEDEYDKRVKEVHASGEFTIS